MACPFGEVPCGSQPRTESAHPVRTLSEMIFSVRADRLIALVLLLQSRGRMTASQVAAELEISPATARRDLEALSTAGIPVYSQPGRGGGWRLVGGARTDLTGMSAGEARALSRMLGTAALNDPETRVPTMKLIQALPSSLRDEAERLMTAVHDDRVAWGELTDDATSGLSRLCDVIAQRRVAVASYQSKNGECSVRRLLPLGLVNKAGVWYLIADGECGMRIYRVSRFEEIVETNEVFDPPKNFDITDYWDAQADVIEGKRSGVAAVLRVHSSIVPVLRYQFGRYFTLLEEGDMSVVEVRAHMLVGLAERLAGWGDRIDVLSPPCLRSELARIGSELVAHYGSPR